jgi:hypothetical protein
MDNNKKVLSEGLLYSLVDNFFKALEKGAADKFYDKVKKSDLHPEAKKAMEGMIDYEKKLKNALKKYHSK